MLCSVHFSYAEINNPKTEMQEAGKYYESGDFSKSIAKYEELFSAGYFSELSLYRLAYIHDNLREYPQAIYYLKRLSQEYGGHHVDSKIIQLLQKNGSASYLTDELWTGYFLFWNRWAWVLWSLFIASAVLLAIRFILAGKEEKIPVGLLTLAPASVLGLTVIIISTHLFLAPNRAVIVNPTSFYTGPGFGSSWQTGALSTGETVNIVSRSDIWCRIRAGEKDFWVPEFVLKEL